ncbi:MAG: acyltransferase [Acidimicrobiia bacterium]
MPSAERDVFIDFVRAFSLLVVVTWHWVFTIIVWKDDGPHATNPIGFTSGMWLATWLLQVMPLFFYIGGYGHLRSWKRAHERGQSVGVMVRRRLGRLAVPALALFSVWTVLGIVLGAVFDLTWIGRAVELVVSPLWFIAVYLLLVVMLPVTLWLHERFDSIVLVWMVGLAALVDITRFKYDKPWIGLINMIVVWGLCHQLGFFYERIVRAARRADWTLLWGGLFGLVALVYSGIYPGSMVGVPGQLSNMAPPTLCIAALVAFQAGTAEILRPWLTNRLTTRHRWATTSELINRFSMPLFLFHSTGMAMHRAVRYGVLHKRNEPVQPDLSWWLNRPLSFVGPLLFTLPVIYLFGRRWIKPESSGRLSP